MTVKVGLVVEGVDILAEDFLETTAAEFENVHWAASNGIVTAVLLTEGDPVPETCTFSRQLEFGGVGRVERVDPDFVNVSEIAARLQVTRETVRLWVEGLRGPGGFPRPDHFHGGGAKGPMKVWRWSSVNLWLDAIGLGDGFRYPSAGQIAEIESHLHRVAEPVSSEWKAVSRSGYLFPSGDARPALALVECADRLEVDTVAATAAEAFAHRLIRVNRTKASTYRASSESVLKVYG